jgi:hypothetical protein
MDPDATLDEFVSAIEMEDWDAASTAADALQAWLSNGGFVPTVDNATLDFMIATIMNLHRCSSPVEDDAARSHLS